MADNTKRPDYTIPGLTTPVNQPPQERPAAATGPAEFDPEAFMSRTQEKPLTDEEVKRVQDSLNEIHNTGDKAVAPSWEGPNLTKASSDVVEATKPAYCPNCHFNLSNQVEDIPITDKREFLRSVLANRSFTKTYVLLNGKVSITFRARTTAVDLLIEKQLQMDMANKRFVPAADPEWNKHYYMNRMSKLWLTASLVSYAPSSMVDLPEMCTAAAIHLYGGDDDRDTHLSKAESKLFLSMPIAVFNLISTTFMRFTGLLTRLTLAAESPNFWKETDGAI